MKHLDWRKESSMLSSGMPSNKYLQECHTRFLTLSMLLVFLQRRTHLMDSQFQDLWRDKLIGLFIISTQRDGSSAGHLLEELAWCLSGSILLTSISQCAHKVQTMRITFVLRMPRLVPFGRDASGPSLIQCTDTTCQLFREALNSTFIIQMMQSSVSRVHTIPKIHTHQTDTIKAGET